MLDPAAQVNGSVQRMLRGSKEVEERTGGKVSKLISNCLWEKFGVKVSRARKKIQALPNKPEFAKLGVEQKILMAAGSLFFARLKKSKPNIVFDFKPTLKQVAGTLLDDKQAKAMVNHYKIRVDPNRVAGKMIWLSKKYPVKERSYQIYYYMALGSEVIIDYSLPSHATQNIALLAISALLEHSQTTRLCNLTADNNDRDPSTFQHYQEIQSYQSRPDDQELT
ncbi:hypothetical protein PsorP6_005659 [Peronosclerospora sorghi]|uniref:Uncharacterized protein n=1 Tax=Peronosclerospora sorghi TaxID=230839 RepID=A0ACC0W808_9STRA|nr:hypothetical protein PsorP6_005659 [Peronosclerospora sorghi]